MTRDLTLGGIVMLVTFLLVSLLMQAASGDVFVGRLAIKEYGAPDPWYDVSFDVLIEDGQMLHADVDSRMGNDHYVGFMRPITGTLDADGYDLIVHDVPHVHWPDRLIDIRFTPQAMHYRGRAFDVTLDASQMAEVGDSNLDGLFTSGDLVQVMQFGKYERRLDTWATWIEGDWNVDGYFDSGDLVAAFQAGTYEQPKPTAIPEPSAVALLSLGLVLWHRRHRDPRARIPGDSADPPHRLT